MTERMTSMTAEARGLGNVYRVVVVGRHGSFSGVRVTLAEARTTAVKYARMLDAPRSVLDDAREVG